MMPRPAWFRSLYWRIALGSVALLAVLLVAQAIVFLWMSGTIATTTPTYTWQAVPGMTWYYLWVEDTTGTKVQIWMEATTAGCGSGTGTCSYTPSTAIAPGPATWWIAGRTTSR